jgi:putative SOS response-associated peptidase YedK
MCGRYAVTTAPEAIRTLFGYSEQPDFPPRYNVAPTQPIAIVRLVNGKRQFALVRCCHHGWRIRKTFPC